MLLKEENNIKEESSVWSRGKRKLTFTWQMKHQFAAEWRGSSEEKNCLNVKYCKSGKLLQQKRQRKNIFNLFVCKSECTATSKCITGASGGSVGRAGAPYTEAVSLPQRSWVRFHLWPFAACHSRSLSPVSCLFFSCPVRRIKAQKIS